MLLPLAKSTGHLLDDLVDRFAEGLGDLGGTDAKGRQKVARLFLLAGELELASRFLPVVGKPEVEADRVQLELLAD